MTFKVGEIVRNTKDPTKVGEVAKLGKKVGSIPAVTVMFFDDPSRLKTVPISTLELLPRVPQTVAELYQEGKFAAPEWLRRSLSRLRVTGRLSDLVYSMEATETDFYAYQFKPVLKLLNSPTDGLLIADEVGLGKTIEAGLIWTELRARFESNRLLVLCPKTLCVKWKMELQRRFGVDARIVKAPELLDALEDPISKSRGFALVASIQSLRPPKGWREMDPRNASPQTRLAHFIDDAAETDPLFDLLVIDEAHHLRNPATLNFSLGEYVSAVSSHKLFLSATPIHLRSRDLHSLLRLVDPDTFEFHGTLEELIVINRPLVQARDLVLKQSTSRDQILELLKSAQLHGFLRESKTLEQVINRLEHQELDTAARSEIATRLEGANQLANYINRTRRRDVQEFRVIRRSHCPAMKMHPTELEFYQAVTDEVSSYALQNDIAPGFLLATPQRLLTSCFSAASAHWSAMGNDGEFEDFDSDIDESQTDPGPLQQRLGQLSRELNLTSQLRDIDTKYQTLLVRLQRVWKDDRNAKIIVFSGFKPTLRYLAERLCEDSINSVVLHGDIKEPRDRIIESFRDGPNARVLLSSEIGSEGIDLQFCSNVVNYDIPWNPMVMEQRIGRVDRLGQKSESVDIVSLVFEDTIDMYIYDRLYDRLELIEKTLGGFEAILGKLVGDVSKILTNPSLTDDEKQAQLEQTAQAAENTRREEERLEDEAGSLMRHGDLILQRINEAREHRRWLSGRDVFLYVRDRLVRSFPGSSIDASPPGSETYAIVLSQEGRSTFDGFLVRRKLTSQTRLLTGIRDLRFEFTASVVQPSGGKIENISQIHPLVRFAVELDRRDELDLQAQPVAARLSAKSIKGEVDPGFYVLALQQWCTTSTEFAEHNSVRLAYSAFSCLGKKLDADTAEVLANGIAEQGDVFTNPGANGALVEATHILTNSVLPDLESKAGNFFAEFRAETDDRGTIQRRAVERHQNNKKTSLDQQVINLKRKATQYELNGDTKKAQRLRSLSAATQGKLRKLHESCERRLKEIALRTEFQQEILDVSAVFLEVTN